MRRMRDSTTGHAGDSGYVANVGPAVGGTSLLGQKRSTLWPWWDSAGLAFAFAFAFFAFAPGLAFGFGFGFAFGFAFGVTFAFALRRVGAVAARR
jgi:hypothetical protein